MFTCLGNLLTCLVKTTGPSDYFGKFFSPWRLCFVSSSEILCQSVEKQKKRKRDESCLQGWCIYMLNFYFTFTWSVLLKLKQERCVGKLDSFRNRNQAPMCSHAPAGCSVEFFVGFHTPLHQTLDLLWRWQSVELKRDEGKDEGGKKGDPTSSRPLRIPPSQSTLGSCQPVCSKSRKEDVTLLPKIQI